MYEVKMSLSPYLVQSSTLDLKSLNFDLIHRSNKTRVHVFNLVLDDINQLKWFMENEVNIRFGVLPFGSKHSNSLAKTIHDFYEALDVEVTPSDAVDGLYTYRREHGLRFAFRGVEMPDIYIGLNNKEYEISCFDRGVEFAFAVDIDGLFDEVKALLCC